ncbi:alpha/beta fold hydrolase [Rugamonas apoptosis]|uniref:Alpha/beta hydrolase n=1 Tax=Rugamonas apoptosis TaxID=2758570 RepID=A0A7W2ILX1_9BURK|nr:alpha/beta hydrolase [Rugamonas apoptosis]MBA5688906.1 alpha/beta hydrolase [Rugamonas apoptosis]
MLNAKQHSGTHATEQSFVKVAPTVTLRYEKSGEGPPLVLLHTIRTQIEYFRELAPLLAKKFTVYAVDLPGHGLSSIDTSELYDEPYMRKQIIAFLQSMDLRGVTMVGESIGAVISLTTASDVPGRVKAVYALNTYDYETRYGDGLRRGNWFANLIIGGLQIPVFGAIAAAIATPWIVRKVMGGGYADPRKLPADLLALFFKAGSRPHYHYVERKVLAVWRSWSTARERYFGVEAPVTLIYGEKDWSRVPERYRTRDALKNVRMFTLRNTGHFSAVENPQEVAKIILA